jgi:hypothetical protein
MYYQIMFYGGLTGAVIALAVSILVYIKMNITQVIEHLTGFRFRKNSKKSRNNQIKPNNVGEKRTTKEIQIRKKVSEQEQAWAEAVAATELIGGRVEATALLSDEYSQETSILSGALDETTLLTADQETSLLTGILDEENQASFKKELDIMIVHSERIISH